MACSCGNQKGYKPLDTNGKRKRDEADENVQEGSEDVTEDVEVEDTVQQPDEEVVLPPEEAARRAQRLSDLQMQSDELLRTRKRRRRIRGYGHLPPDEPIHAATLRLRKQAWMSAKPISSFSNELYLQIREKFDAICREMGIVKMSQCAEGQWQAAKDRLTRENMHLSSVLHPLQPELNKRLNALNCICSDVTKRMRNESKKFSIADASNILGLDPLQSKEIRRVFYEILEADHFTTVRCMRETPSRRAA